MSFGIMGCSADFIKAACVRKKQYELRFIGSSADISIYQISCSGKITVTSTKNGEQVTDEYKNLTDSALTIQSDANTEVVIFGDVRKITFAKPWYDGYFDITSINTSKATKLEVLNLDFQSSLTSVDLSENAELKDFEGNNCTSVVSFDFSHNIKLERIHIPSCTSLTSVTLPNTDTLKGYYCANCSVLETLDLTYNGALENISCDNCSLNLIKYAATNAGVSDTIGTAVVGGTVTNGTLYTDVNGVGYSTLSNKVAMKNWTIEQLS